MEGVRSHPSSILTSLTKCHQCILTLRHEKVAGVVFSSGYRPQESNSCAQMPVSAVFLVVPGSSAQPPPAPPKGCRWPSCPKPHLQVPWGHLDCLRCPKPSPEVLTVLVRKQGCSGTGSTMYPSNSKTTCMSLQNTFQIERGKPYVVSWLSEGKQLSCGCHVLLINTQHSGLRNLPFRLHLWKAE